MSIFRSHSTGRAITFAVGCLIITLYSFVAMSSLSASSTSNMDDEQPLGYLPLSSDSSSSSSQLLLLSFQREVISSSSQRFQLLSDAGGPVSYHDFLVNLRDNREFRSLFVRLLQSIEFSGFLFECPAVSRATVHDVPFEFVVTDSPSLDLAPVDTKTFAEPLAQCGASGGHSAEPSVAVVSFPNLGRDALLMSPCHRPGSHLQAYAHLAAFVRRAPSHHISQVWREVANKLLSTLASPARSPAQDLWFSTNGNGVAWLHFRLDSVPKYFAHQPFKTRSADALSSRSARAVDQAPAAPTMRNQLRSAGPDSY